MPVNIALLGSGIFANTAYLPAIIKSSEVKLHTIWSRSEKSVTQLAENAKKDGISAKAVFGADALEAVLDDKEIEAVLIVLPISLQPSFVLKALSKGKHVMSEKPIAKDCKHALKTIEQYEKEYKPKGLIWRVAENFAHEPMIRYAGDLLKGKEFGPVLYWQLVSQGAVIDGSNYHATEWRTVPDYQGGFLLDGGVHQTALLRTVLPTLPSTIISSASLHRAHLLPHDTIMALALPKPEEHTQAHGNRSKLPSPHTESDIPTAIGESAPHGSILISFALPDLPAEGKTPASLVVTTLNGKLEISAAPDSYTVKTWGANGSDVKATEKKGGKSGVPTEIDMFARAVAGTGKDEPDLGTPRGALWDLAVIEAALHSNGKPVSLDHLTGGQ